MVVGELWIQRLHLVPIRHDSNRVRRVVEECVPGQTWGPVAGNIFSTFWDFECGPDVPGVGCLVDMNDQGFMGKSRVPIGSIRHYMDWAANNNAGTRNKCVAFKSLIPNISIDHKLSKINFVLITI